MFANVYNFLNVIQSAIASNHTGSNKLYVTFYIKQCNKIFDKKSLSTKNNVTMLTRSNQQLSLS